MPLPLWDNLWLDCEDAFQRGDYASVVIWGHSAIETLSLATILSWLHEQSFDVDRAAELVARNRSHIGQLKQCLSLEEIVEVLNDTHKVEIALLRVMNADPSWGFDFCSRFESQFNSFTNILSPIAKYPLKVSPRHFVNDISTDLLPVYIVRFIVVFRISEQYFWNCGIFTTTD